MKFDLTPSQKTAVWFFGFWVVLLLIGAFAGTQDQWGQTAVYVAGGFLWLALMQFLAVSVLSRIILGFILLIASLGSTVIFSVTLANAIEHIDPLMVWSTTLHHAQVIVMMPRQIFEGASQWVATGDPDAFRQTGCAGHHLFLALLIGIAVIAMVAKGMSGWARTSS
ncbi:MAG: hypothetical protein WDZ82_02840 [Candidatus Paceibacterota bacterium]